MQAKKNNQIIKNMTRNKKKGEVNDADLLPSQNNKPHVRN
jgi:hypothetical protein